eukprot:8393046-Pyramimonas_sp.AAC.1
MRRLPPGHRTMRLDDFGMPTPGAVFKCPPSVLSQHPEVKGQDFRSETMSRYIIVSPPSSSGPGSGSIPPPRKPQGAARPGQLADSGPREGAGTREAPEGQDTNSQERRSQLTQPSVLPDRTKDSRAALRKTEGEERVRRQGRPGRREACEFRSFRRRETSRTKQ